MIPELNVVFSMRFIYKVSCLGYHELCIFLLSLSFFWGGGWWKGLWLYCGLEHSYFYVCICV